MTHEDRIALKYLIDKAVREKINTGYLDCDPESLTISANNTDDLGHTEVAQALRSFRDNVVNKLLGEGWDLNRIEMAALNWSKEVK